MAAMLRMYFPSFQLSKKTLKIKNLLVSHTVKKIKISSGQRNTRLLNRLSLDK